MVMYGTAGNMDEAQNYKRRLLLIVIGLVLGPIVLFFILRFVGTGRINITINGATDKTSIQIINQSNGKTVTTAGLSDDSFSKMLPTGNYELRVASNDKRLASTYLVSVPRFFRATSKTAQLNNQASRQKLARDVSDCPVLASGQLYSYTCGWSNTLSRHIPLTAQAYSKREDYQISGIVTATAYRDGILALRITDQSALALTISFIRNGEVVSNKALPPSFTDNEPGSNASYSLNFDRKGSEAFVVAKKDTGIEALFYTNLETEPKEIKSQIPGQDLNERASSIDLFDKKLLVAYGESSDDHGDHGEREVEESTEKLPTVMRVYDTSSLDEAPKEYKTDQPITKVSFCGGGICVLRDTTLLVYATSGTKLSLRGVISDVDDVIPLGPSHAAYQQGNTVYKLDVASLSGSMLYRSDRFALTSINLSGQGILMQAALEDSTKRPVTHMFQLATEPDTTNRAFLDEKLPYASDGTIWDMDYYGSTILSTIILNSAVLDRDTGKLSYDEAEYKQATQQIFERLAIDGFDNKNFNIGFIVSY